MNKQENNVIDWGGCLEYSILFEHNKAGTTEWNVLPSNFVFIGVYIYSICKDNDD